MTQKKADDEKEKGAEKAAADKNAEILDPTSTPETPAPEPDKAPEPDATKDPEGDEAPESVSDIEKSSLNSAVTTDMANLPGEEAAQAEAEAEHVERDPMVKAGLGLIKLDGGGFDYVGIAPAREGNAETPDGRRITGANSTFTPLSSVPFANSIRIKDPATGEFYYPGDGVKDWDGCELNGSYLVPRD